MKTLLLLDRVFEWLSTVYHKHVFLARIGSTEKTVNVLGKITVNMPLPKGMKRNIHIGKDVTIYPGVYFWGEGSIEIGDHVTIGKDCIVYSRESITIGAHSSIAAQCYLIDSDHGFLSSEQYIWEQKMNSIPIVIGEDVWIAANCTILKGVNIGDGAVIGAKSLVNKDVKSNTVVAGNPARVIKVRT